MRGGHVAERIIVGAPAVAEARLAMIASLSNEAVHVMELQPESRSLCVVFPVFKLSLPRPRADLVQRRVPVQRRHCRPDWLMQECRKQRAEALAGTVRRVQRTPPVR